MAESKNTSGIWVLVILVIAGGWYFFGRNNQTDPTTSVETDTSIKATTVKVGTFYDGQNGYSLSIPSGNSSTCIWNYEGGNADIPYSQTTYARTATEKHTIYSGDYYDWKVSCVDDFGNHYIGVFPKQ